MLLKIDPQTLLKINPQVLLKTDPQTLLKIGFTSGAKLKNLIARTAQSKSLNKTKQNYAKKCW